MPRRCGADEIEDFIRRNPGDYHRIESALECTQDDARVGIEVSARNGGNGGRRNGNGRPPEIVHIAPPPAFVPPTVFQPVASFAPSPETQFLGPIGPILGGVIPEIIRRLPLPRLPAPRPTPPIRIPAPTPRRRIPPIIPIPLPGGGTEEVSFAPRRRMNVTNSRALKRALRRLCGFERLARSVLVTTPKFKRGCKRRRKPCR